MPNRYADTGELIAGSQPPAVAADASDKTPPPRAEDESQPSTLRKAWDIWTSHPSNNAAMLQFGINMLSPEGGGSGLGQFGRALGAGAEASTRNVTGQEELAQKEEETALKERGVAAKELEAGAYAANAGEGRGARPLSPMQIELKAQAAFNSWLNRPEDTTGVTKETATETAKRMFPGVVKDKTDAVMNPQAKRVILDMFRAQQRAESGGGGAGFVPPPGAVPRLYQGKTIWYDPTSKQPYPGQQ